MGGTRRRKVVEFLGVEGKTEGSADTRTKTLAVAESKNTSIVNLSLQEGRVIEVTRTSC